MAPHAHTAGWPRLDTMIVAGAIAVALVSGIASFRTDGPYGDRRMVDPRVRKEYDSRTGELQLVVFDSDGNRRLDTWSYMRGARLLRMEVDADEDGTIDRRSFYGPEGELNRTEYIDPTGHVLSTESFKDGAPVGSGPAPPRP